jgi:alpha-methylacyl-CoA racemase
MGPLAGLKVVEFAGIGAGPHCAMMLADMGADVVRIDRPAPAGLGVDVDPRFDLVLRSRRSVAIDLKRPEGREVALQMVAQADALIESFRPGVMERIGLGPDMCLKQNPRLVYARLTGWGQDGPYAQMAGHDINYVALSGALNAIGSRRGPPQPPLNLLGDFGGGAVHCAFGIVSALLHAQRCGEGQVVDAAMLDGVTALMTMVSGFRRAGIWTEQRNDNIVDGGAPYYSAYETADQKYVAIGAMEGKFYELLLDKLGLSDLPHMRPHTDRNLWERQRATLELAFKAKTRSEWCELLEGTDVCFAPVLTMDEALEHPHVRARQTYVEVEGVAQPAPAPRFSQSQAAISRPPARPGQHTTEALQDWGWSTDAISRLLRSGVLVQEGALSVQQTPAPQRDRAERASS